MKLSPDHLGANLQLSGCFDQIGHTKAAQAFSYRGKLLSNIDGNYNIMRGGIEEKMVYETVDLLGELGRHWEAAGWCYVMTRLDEPSPKAVPELFRRLSRIQSQVGPSDPAFLPIRLARPTDFSSPRWPVPDIQASPRPRGGDQTIAWNFTDNPPDPKQGLVAGRYRVVVRPLGKPSVKMTDPNYNQMMKGGSSTVPKPLVTEDTSVIPKPFQSLETTKLILEVKPGPNNFDIDLAKIK